MSTKAREVSNGIDVRELASRNIEKYGSNKRFNPDVLNTVLKEPGIKARVNDILGKLCDGIAERSDGKRPNARVAVSTALDVLEALIKG